MIQHRKIKHLGKPVSRLIMGTMILDHSIPEKSGKLLDDVFAAGINTFDSAAVYGTESEQTLGAWVNSRGIREQVVIITKGAHHNAFRKRVTPYDIYADCHDSLAKTGLDYIDIYLLHRDDPTQPVGPVVESLNRLYEAGIIKCFGGSNWTWDRIEAANEYACKYNLMPFSASSPNYSLAVQVDNPWGDGCVTLSGDNNEQERRFYARTGMPILAYSSLGRGFLSGLIQSDRPQDAAQLLDPAAQRGYMYPENFERLRRAEVLSARYEVSVPQIATAWLMHQPLCVYAIVGAQSGKEMQENIDALDINISPEELCWLNLETDEI